MFYLNFIRINTFYNDFIFSVKYLSNIFSMIYISNMKICSHGIVGFFIRFRFCLALITFVSILHGDQLLLKAMKYISCEYAIKIYENEEWSKSMFSSVFNLFCFPWELTLFISFAYILRLNLCLRHYSKQFNIFCFSLMKTVPITFSSLINVFFFLPDTFLQKFIFNKLSTILLFRNRLPSGRTRSWPTTIPVLFSS